MLVQVASSAQTGNQLVNNANIYDAEGNSSNSSYATIVGIPGGDQSSNSVGSQTYGVTFPSSYNTGSTGTSIEQAFELGRPTTTQTGQSGPVSGGDEPKTSVGEIVPTPEGEAPQTEEVAGTTTPAATSDATTDTGAQNGPVAGGGDTALDPEVARTAPGETIIKTEGGVEHIIITENKIEITREQLPSASTGGSSKYPEFAPAVNDVGTARKGGSGAGGRCESVMSLMATHNPNPVLIGGRITYILTYTNNSPDQTMKGVTLKDVLPAGMVFVPASDGGSEFGNVIAWKLGDMEPGASGSRKLVARADFASTSGAFLINNNA